MGVSPESIQLIAPTIVRRAICRKAEVVPPLQYYSQIGEAIYVCDFSSHQVLGKLFVHLDPNGKLLAQIFMGETNNQERIYYQNVSPVELQNAVSLDLDFAECLLVMHLIADQSPSPIIDQVEFNQLKEKSLENPIVIGGCGRSGTTLLLSVLGAHPHILAFPEELYAFYPKPFRLSKLLDAVNQYGSDRSWQRWCEKTPKNVRVFRDLQYLFQDRIKIIHMVRDGRDVVTSHHPNDSSLYYVAPERWVSDVRCGLTFEGSSLLVRYEDLVKDPELEIKRICEYINEDYDARMLAHERFSTVQENKAWDGLRAMRITTEGIGRWQKPENVDRVQEFMNFPGAMELMRQLRYA